MKNQKIKYWNLNIKNKKFNHVFFLTGKRKTHQRITYYSSSRTTLEKKKLYPAI